MIRTAILMLIILIVSGCAPQTYYNLKYPNSNFEQDSNMCRQYANGNTPLPEKIPVPESQTVSGIGTINHPDGMLTPFTYTYRVDPNPYTKLQVQTQNMASVFESLAIQEMHYEKCLASLGWYPEDELSKRQVQESKNNINYSKCLEKNAPIFAEHIKDFDQLASDLKTYCEKSTSGFQRNLEKFYARQALDAQK